MPLGLLAASRRRTTVDRSIVAFSVAGVSAPAFATGLLLLYVFAVRLSWFPVFGQGSGFFDRIWHLTLPAIALGLTGMGLILRLTRAGAASAFEQDYVAFARARGIPRRRIMRSYVLRNALVPIVTASGLIFAYLIAGAVLVETTFALPGVGSLLVEAINNKDIPVVQGLAMLIALTVVVINLLTDLVYLAIDPRIAFEAARRMSERDRRQPRRRRRSPRPAGARPSRPRRRGVRRARRRGRLRGRRRRDRPSRPVGAEPARDADRAVVAHIRSARTTWGATSSRARSRGRERPSSGR